MRAEAALGVTLRRVPLFENARAEQLMSMPAVPTRHWTVQEVERLIEEREGYTPRYELADGELLVSPSPTRRHQRIVLRLALRLAAYVDRLGVGEVAIGPVSVRLRPDSYFEPDLCVIPPVAGRRPRAGTPITELSLAIEVLSHGSIRHDRITKRKHFQRNGVLEYWIVDGDAETFEVWHPDDARPAIEDEHVTWQPPGAAEPFRLDVREFFVEVADEP